MSQQQPPTGPKKQAPKKAKQPGQGNTQPQSKPPAQTQQSQNITLLQHIPIKPARTKAAPGRTVRLITNLFKISLRQNKPIYSYTVNIEEAVLSQPKGDEPAKANTVPRKIPRAIRHKLIGIAIEDWVKETKPSDYHKNIEFNYVLDNGGNALYALFNMFAQTSQAGKMSLSFDAEFEERNFAVKINRVGMLNIDDFVKYCGTKRIPNSAEVQEHTRALNTLLQGMIYTVDRFVVMQAKTGTATVFPYEKKNQFEISPGVFCNRGYSLSTRPSEIGIVLNVANTVAPFYDAIDLTEFIKKRYCVNDFSQPLKPFVIQQLEKELKNKQVEVKHLKYGTKFKKHRIESISGSAKKDKFMLVDQKTKTTKEVTIEEYFNKQYPQFRLKYPNLPCIVDKGKKLPFELCRLVDKQKVARKLDPKETANVITQAALKPLDHFRHVTDNVAEISQYTKPLNDFGLELDPRPIEVEGREIEPLALQGGSRKPIRPNNGEYKLFDKFLRPTTVKKFAVAFLVDSFVKRDIDRLEDDTRQKFLPNYCRFGRDKGVSIDPKGGAVDFLPSKTGSIEQMNEAELKGLLKSYVTHLNKSKFDHAIIVLPERCPDFVYAYMQYLETSVAGGRSAGEKWSRTSCVKFSNFTKKILWDQRFNGSLFISNLWLKYNTKLGGLNVSLCPNPSLNFLKDGFIFISVDVCHPAPGDRLTQSIAAVMGMWDIATDNTSFCTRIRAQRKERSTKDKSTVEEVMEIDVMVSDVLESYRKKKKKLPTHIVILRDGVSEGQFIMVSNYELGKVKAALHNKYQMSKLADPLISCVIVQKRHKIRLRRKEPVTDRKGQQDYNIQPGTVVDHTITRPNEFSFYIAPHKAIQGTSRAPYAFFIYDQIKFDQDTAQTMIHALSYLSPRCNKSTSIPTPVNLADLAAERGKNIVVSWNNDNLKIPDKERFEKLNKFLSDGLADEEYKNTLYYV